METYHYLETLMRTCIKHKVTDIHIDLAKDYLVLRQNKKLIMRYPYDNMERLFNHLKYKSRMKMDSIMEPQTGSFEYYCLDMTLFFRFAALETLNRQHGVLRILNLLVLDSLESCGMGTHDIKKLRGILGSSNGLIVFAGKTGAGKSTSMYASLDFFCDRQVFSLESPIERVIPSIIQIEYQAKDLEAHITQLLRHDPDLLVIGEIRKAQELEHVIRAALSGHLVMTTLHAGSVSDVLLRLNDLNYSKFDLRSVIRGVVYQYVSHTKEGTVFTFEVFNQKDLESNSNFAI